MKSTRIASSTLIAVRPGLRDHNPSVDDLGGAASGRCTGSAADASSRFGKRCGVRTVTRFWPGERVMLTLQGLLHG
jgi:hypothetical protein